MTINRNGPDKLGRTFQASATEIQANLLNRKRSQLNDKSEERRGATAMRQQRSSSSAANRLQQHEMGAFAKSRVSRTMMSHQHRAGTEQAPAEAASSQPMAQQEVWTSTEDLFWDHMREVQNKWNTLKLNDDIWAKLIYFEQNRRLAKAYVSTPVLTIDGSTNGLDGFRIGLSGIENSYRDLDSIACLRSIGQGIKLKIDHQGNILIKRLVPVQRRVPPGGGGGATTTANCSVWVKEWPASAGPMNSRVDNLALDAQLAKGQGAPPGPKAPATSSSNISNYSQLSSSSYSSSSGSSPSRSSFEHRSSNSDRNPPGWPMQEISDPDRTYKLFDMQKFRLQLERSRRRAERYLVDGTTTTPIDWRQCVSIISFDRRQAFATGRPSKPNQGQVLSDPCWLMLINIIAIDMLKSSVCDSAVSSPQSQTSSLINRYEEDNLRMAARKLLPPLPVSGDNKLGPVSWAGHPQQQQRQLSQYNQQTASSLEQPEFRSERLRRLNRKRYDEEPSARPEANTVRTSLSANGKRFDGNKLSQPEGSIYTTFTGKYLDKQHRRRANEARRELGVEFELERGPHLVMSKLSERKSTEARYSVEPYGRRLSCAVNAAGTGNRRPPTGGSQLTHSLSAFDLSHGLKLNLRSINTSSIKMNFDDDDDDEELDGREDDDGRQGELEGDQTAGGRDRGLEMVAKRRGNAQEDLFSKLRLKAANEKTLASLARNQRKASRPAQDASSEWVDLAKKYASIRNSNEAHEDEPERPLAGDVKHYDDDDDDDNNKDYTDANGDGKQNEAEPGESNASTLQQNKSRSSIASSSSGCADNDYFNSQSSPSSMSSSTTRSNGVEELTSQPASSSGINSASDDYERCRPKRPTEDGTEIEPTGNTKEDIGGYQEQQPTRRSNGAASNHQRGSRLDVESEEGRAEEPHFNRHKNVKKAISLSRASNGKSLDLSPIEPEFDCKDCQHLDDECNAQEQCDCGAPTCDRMMFTLDGHMSSPHGICDCYCDCLSHQPDGQTAPGAFAHPSHCQDELLCDCGAGDMAPLDFKAASPRVDHHDEEPIYDQLPRFGRSNCALPDDGTSGKRAGEASAKSPRRRTGGGASRGQGLVLEHSDRIVPLPASTLDRHQTKSNSPLKKSTSATNLKRTGGWLEGSRYMKLLPRFMSFGSKPESYSNRKLPTMEKSGTLDRAGQLVSRFTRSRSSQNLTK